MKHKGLIIAVLAFVVLCIGYFMTRPAETLPLVTPEGVAVLQIQVPPGQVRENITDIQKISPLVHYYRTSKILRSSAKPKPDKLLVMKMYDGTTVKIWPQSAKTVAIGIIEKNAYHQYNVESVGLADYLAAIR